MCGSTSSTTVGPHSIERLTFQASHLLLNIAHLEMCVELAFVHSVFGIQRARQAALSAPFLLSFAPRGLGIVVVVPRSKVLMVPTPD